MAEDACANCSASPLDISLVLTCDHRLCMVCAAAQVQWAGGHDPSAKCPRCGSVTEVDPSAAQHILEVGGQQRRLGAGHGGGGSGGAPARQWPAPSASNLSSADFGAPSWAGAQARSYGDAGRPVRSQPVLPMCGQCQSVPAELDCQQCQERFCADCSAAMHRVGRMREHALVPLEGGSSSSKATAGLGRQAVPEQALRSVPSFSGEGLSGPPQRDNCHCEVHPDEPLQFFCFDCETEPVCAECVVHHGSRHHGHRVLKLRDAFQRLRGEEMLQLEQVGRERTEDRAQAAQRADALRRDLVLTINQGRQRIKEAFSRLRSNLNHKEAQLIAGMEDCARAADGTLAERLALVDERAGEVWQTHTMLSAFDTRGSDEVKALNTYATSRVTVHQFLEPFPGVDDGGVAKLLEGLKKQLRDSMADQATAITSLGARALEIRRGAGGVADDVGGSARGG